MEVADHSYGTVILSDGTGSGSCVAPEGASNDTLQTLQAMNCGRVDTMNTDLADLVGHHKLRDDPSIAEAAARCRRSEKALAAGNISKAADLALSAWSDLVMKNTECCDSSRPPYCRSLGISWYAHVMPLLLASFYVLLVALLPYLCRDSFEAPALLYTRQDGRRGRGRGAGAGAAASPSGAAEGPAPELRGPKAPGPTADAAGSRRFAAELEQVWMHPESGSSLRVLPGAADWAQAAANLFSELQRVYGFQPDSVRNQFEHLLSLWRSHCSMVADGAHDLGIVADESKLLQAALESLHLELLDGYRLFRDQLHAVENSSHAGTAVGPRWDWSRLPRSPGDLSGQQPKMAARLTEVGLFLLIWGEAGNVRFMPEAVCFLTELALTADQPVTLGTGDFLSSIIRPMYNAIFNVNYDQVAVDEKGKDSKKLKQGCEKFLPPDCPNYDDWNELFQAPAKLLDTLVLGSGNRLMDELPPKRFELLQEVDWARTFSSASTKTHREVHSLWGVFAACHRIWLAHLLLFLTGMCWVAVEKLPENQDLSDWTEVPLLGNTASVRWANLGLLVPLHAAMWKYSRWCTSGFPIRRSNFSWCGVFRMLGLLLVWALPLATYGFVRYAEVAGEDLHPNWGLTEGLLLHLAVSAAGFVVLLFFPAAQSDRIAGELTRPPLRTRLCRDLFWLVILVVKFLASLQVIRAMFQTTRDLHITLLGTEPLSDITKFAFSPAWDRDVVTWLSMWVVAFVLFVSDTQLWFVLGCSMVGTFLAFWYRDQSACNFMLADAVANIPKLFSAKVLAHDLSTAPGAAAGTRARGTEGLAPSFPAIWDRIVEWMRYEDKLDDSAVGELSYYPDGGDLISWQSLNRPVGRDRRPVATGASSSSGVSSEAPTPRVPQPSPRARVPQIFTATSASELFLKRGVGLIPDPDWPKNPEVQWRLLALARGLSLPLPRPFRAPNIPGISVLIPHYGEDIVMVRDKLYQDITEMPGPPPGRSMRARRHSRECKREQAGTGNEEIVPLMSWLEQRYHDEFQAFTNRMTAKSSGKWNKAGTAWRDYQDAEWHSICLWASMRSQTLFRTVAGMMLYHSSLDCHFAVQREKVSLGRRDVWRPHDLFTCLVAMQMYAFFTPQQYEHTNMMLEKFPSSLKIAYIDWQEKGRAAENDNTHPKQQRRYFSCVIDKRCQKDATGRRQPYYRVELPGYPILGDGKGDNQNHAIIYTRGQFIQCIDSNQGGYFEQMLMLPCVLGEFRSSSRRRGGGSKKIIGLPEHITSDIGTIGDFAAGAETAFGTLLQRTYAALGARMHYGHPDIMNKSFMIQQGGVSKATKTVHLSEDIFAGMDFTLRGRGREVHHCEYFHVAKGRDLGFNTVLMFFSKLSAGTGEQLLTRQVMRLGQLLPLPELLTFFYAHGGFYLTQHLVSRGPPLILFLWLLVVLDSAESNFAGVDQHPVDGAGIIANLLSTSFSWLILLFLAAQTAPLVMEMWLQSGVVAAVVRFIKQMLTGAPLHFVFQAKIIGIYVTNELRYGGATYVNTGRGLPTERRPFIGPLDKGGGLYMDFAEHAFYDGAMLLMGSLLVLSVGGAQGVPDWWLFTLVLTILSWLYTPFIFNPYQFVSRFFVADLGDWYHFFWKDGAKQWTKWYEKKQLKPASGLRVAPADVVISFFFIGAWYTAVNNKMHILGRILSGYGFFFSREFVICPPFILSLLSCIIAGAVVGARGQQANLPFLAAGVVVTDLLETWLALEPFRRVGFFKTGGTGLVLKYAGLSLLLLGAECILRMRFWTRGGSTDATKHWFTRPIYLWLSAHRYTTDAVISMFIFLSLTPFVLFDSLRTRLCRGCSLHQLLVYRDPGHVLRIEAEVAHREENDSFISGGPLLRTNQLTPVPRGPSHQPAPYPVVSPAAGNRPPATSGIPHDAEQVEIGPGGARPAASAATLRVPSGGGAAGAAGAPQQQGGAAPPVQTLTAEPPRRPVRTGPPPIGTVLPSNVLAGTAGAGAGAAGGAAEDLDELEAEAEAAAASASMAAPPSALLRVDQSLAPRQRPSSQATADEDLLEAEASKGAWQEKS